MKIKLKNLMNSCFYKVIFFMIISSVFVLNVNAEKAQGSITFTNDSVAQVTFEIPVQVFIGEIDYVLLQTRVVYYDLSNKKVKLYPEKVKEIKFKFRDEDIRMISFEDVPYNIPLNPSGPLLLQNVIDGRLSLFIYHSKTGPAGMYVGPGSKWRGKSQDVELIVLKKNSESLYKPRFTDKNFKIDMSVYLSDCPSLVQKIEKDLYSIDNIRQIVKEYNTNCTATN